MALVFIFILTASIAVVLLFKKLPPAKVPAVFICGVTAIVLAGWSAGCGAGIGGLKSKSICCGGGGWGLAFLEPLVCGWLGGFFFTVGFTIFILTRRISWDWQKQCVAILVAAPIAAFAVSSGYYFFTLMPERRQEAIESEFLARVRKDPAIVDKLVERARLETLSPLEKTAINQGLWEKNRFSHDQTVFLLDYFQDEVYSVVSIVRYQPLTDSDLRKVFSRYDNTEDAFRGIYSALIDHPATPMDILKNIAENPRCSEYEKTKATETIAKRLIKAVDSTATRVPPPG